MFCLHHRCRDLEASAAAAAALSADAAAKLAEAERQSQSLEARFALHTNRYDRLFMFARIAIIRQRQFWHSELVNEAMQSYAPGRLQDSSDATVG